MNIGLQLLRQSAKKGMVKCAKGSSGIHIKPSHKGLFTKKAKAAGMAVQPFARKVLAAPKGKYSGSTRKQANFARLAKTTFNK